MAGLVSFPLWLAALLVVLAAWAVLDRILVPSVRWFFARRVSRVIDELNARLRIAIPPFQRTRRHVLIDRLLFDPKLLAAVDEASRDGEVPRAVLLERVARYAREIVPAFNAYFYFRLGTWISRRVARSLYRVRLGAADDAALAAIAPGSTVVFLMNHRSNMDYILVAYLAADRTALSYAVGEWARIWPLQTLIRATGAYFVRRNSGDPLYRRVLERYIYMATAAGVPQAVYPEGGLSRDGRLRPPKLGILDYMLRAFDPEGERDLVFVPVGINYDRTLEDRTLLLDGAEATPPGVLGAAWRFFAFIAHHLALVARGRWHRFGYACVNFGTPISMRRDAAVHGLAWRGAGTERATAVAALGKRLMEAVAAEIPVLPVPLVATVFVAHAEAGGAALSALEVKAAALRLLNKLSAAGARIYMPRRDQDYAVVAGLRTLVLRHLVDEREGLYRARAEEMPLLRYYAASIAHYLEQAPASAAPLLPAGLVTRSETLSPRVVGGP
jgi:glycerol-3-phosphate O-acyltransferase